MTGLVKEFDKYNIYIYMPCKKLEGQRKEKVIRRIIKF